MSKIPNAWTILEFNMQQKTIWKKRWEIDLKTMGDPSCYKVWKLSSEVGSRAQQTNRNTLSSLTVCLTVGTTVDCVGTQSIKTKVKVSMHGVFLFCKGLLESSIQGLCVPQRDSDQWVDPRIQDPREAKSQDSGSKGKGSGTWLPWSQRDPS